MFIHMSIAWYGAIFYEIGIRDNIIVNFQILCMIVCRGNPIGSKNPSIWQLFQQSSRMATLEQIYFIFIA